MVCGSRGICPDANISPPLPVTLIAWEYGPIAAGAFSKTNVEARLQKVGWRELFLVLLGIALFAILLPKLGMVVSLWILIFVSAFASHEFSFKETALSAIVLSILGWVVFAKGLELQMAVWPKFLTQ